MSLILVLIAFGLGGILKGATGAGAPIIASNAAPLPGGSTDRAQPPAQATINPNLDKMTIYPRNTAQIC